MQKWALHEKARADAAAESYHHRLRQEQAAIDSLAAELLAVQMERGMEIRGDIAASPDSEADEQARNDNTDSIAARKLALEEQITAIRIEVMKLETERDNRDRRVKGESGAIELNVRVVLCPFASFVYSSTIRIFCLDIAIEEAKHRIRAHDARVLKEQAEEAKKTTVDDLTRGIVNYKYLGLDFEQTYKENELR